MVTRARLPSVDLLRGIVMVLMALDHVRDFFSSARFEPTDLDRTSPALFFTRFVTHFCAPVFVLLAGTGAFLSSKPKRELAWFLLSRGAWLVVLEVTAVHFGWSFGPPFTFMGLQVIWALGVSMMVLAALVFLPVRAVGAIGLAMILAHDLLDGVHAKDMPEAAASLYRVVHEMGPATAFPGHVFIVYPLVPWIGVMACGYALGPLLQSDGAYRRKRLAQLGVVLLLGFVALRLLRVYGDPSPWSEQATPVFTVLSFLNVSKYPPSLLYLMVTLGPALLALAALDRVDHAASRPILVFGKVPLFYYLLHLPVIHGAAVIAAYVRYGHVPGFLLDGGPFGDIPDGYGYGLAVVYGVWIAVVVGLYPLCAWFARVKSRSRSRWLQYL